MYEGRRWCAVTTPVRKFVLAHESLGYRVGKCIDRLGGYELHPIATPNHFPLRVPKIETGPLYYKAETGPLYYSSAAPAFDHVETVTLHLRRFAHQEQTYPRARRRNARAGTRGRRGARRIPLVCRWEVGVYMAEGTPEPIALRLTERHMGEPVYFEWRRP